MKGFLVALLLIFIGGVGWQVGSMMDTTTTSLIIGILLGTLASVPAALLVIAAQRRRDDDRGQPRERYGPNYPQPYMIMPPQAQPQPQAPVPAPQHYNPYTVTGGGHFDDMPAPAQDGRFRLTGK